MLAKRNKNGDMAPKGSSSATCERRAPPTWTLLFTLFLRAALYVHFHYAPLPLYYFSIFL